MAEWRAAERSFYPETGQQMLDLLAMPVSFIAAMVVASQEYSQISLSEFFALRVKVQNFLFFLGLLAIWHIAFRSFGLYAERRAVPIWRELTDVGLAVSLATIAIFTTGTILDMSLITPAFIWAFWTCGGVLVVASRLLLPGTVRAFRSDVETTKHVLIVGTGPRAVRCARQLTDNSKSGYRLVGFVDQEWPGLNEFRESGYALVATLKDFHDFIRHRVVDEVIICLPMHSFYKQACQIAAASEEQGITVRMAADILDLGTLRQGIVSRTPPPPPVITVYPGSTPSGWGVVVKRGMDIAVSAVLLILLLPLFGAVALLIKLTSPGPVFFVQERVGLNKRRIYVYKFRTMVVDAEERIREIEHLNEVTGPVFKVKRDPRITPIGKFLRKSSIDELPQLFNVLKGDMSLVGPRPLPLRDYQGFDQDWHRRRLSVRPGITCLWQIMGRSNIPFEKWMELDLKYIDEWSLWLDFQILLKTVPVVLKGSGAE